MTKSNDPMTTLVTETVEAVVEQEVQMLNAVQATLKAVAAAVPTAPTHKTDAEVEAEFDNLPV